MFRSFLLAAGCEPCWKEYRERRKERSPGQFNNYPPKGPRPERRASNWPTRLPADNLFKAVTTGSYCSRMGISPGNRVKKKSWKTLSQDKANPASASTALE